MVVNIGASLALGGTAIASSFPTGFGFGAGYGAGVRIGYDIIYPYLSNYARDVLEAVFGEIREDQALGNELPGGAIIHQPEIPGVPKDPTPDFGRPNPKAPAQPDPPSKPDAPSGFGLPVPKEPEVPKLTSSEIKALKDAKNKANENLNQINDQIINKNRLLKKSQLKRTQQPTNPAHKNRIKQLQTEIDKLQKQANALKTTIKEISKILNRQ